MTSVTASPIKPQISRWQWVAAIGLRLALMPLVLHGDVIFIQYFPWYWSYGGIPDMYGHLADTFLKQGFTYYHPLVFWITSLWQMVTRPLAAGFGSWMEQADRLMRGGEAHGILDYLSGFGQADVIRWVVLAKLLYFAVDILCWPLIRSIVRRNPSLAGLQRAWLFHPILLFSVYAFGQYRILPALVVWAAVALFQRGNRQAAVFVFGWLLLLDNFGWLLLLPTVLIWGEGIRERARLMMTALLPAALVLIPWAVVSEGYVLACYFSPVIQKASMQGIFRSLSPEAAVGLKLLFVGLWSVIAFLAWKARGRSDEDRLMLWAAACAAVLLALYATSTTMIHYFMWVLPFWLLARAGAVLRPGLLAVAAITLLFFFNLDSRQMNLGLFVMLDPGLVDVPSLHEIMDQWLSWGKCIALARLAFTVICLYFVFVCCQTLFKHQKSRHPSR